MIQIEVLLGQRRIPGILATRLVDFTSLATLARFSDRPTTRWYE